MRVSRRSFVQAPAASAALLQSVTAAQGRAAGNPLPGAIRALQPLANPAP